MRHKIADTLDALLTPVQMRLTQLVVDAQSNRQIADAFNLTETAVKLRLADIYEITDTASRLELALRYLQEHPGYILERQATLLLRELGVLHA